jgi:hypothetical protein
MASTQSWYLLYPSSSSSSSSPSSSNLGAFYSNCTYFVFVSVAGLFGLRICTNAIRFYYFCIDWNLITQREWADLAALHFFKQNYISRKKLIVESLITTTFGRGTCENNNNDMGTKESVGGKFHTVLKEDATTATIGKHDGCPVSNGVTIRATKPSHCDTETSYLSSCPICLSEFQENEQVSRSKDASSCSHVFHSLCLEVWLLKHTSCPVCRYEMVVSNNPLPPTLEARVPTLIAQSQQIQ